MLATISRKDWTTDTAAHLLNRAGFGGTPEEADALARLSPEQAVAQMVHVERVDEVVEPPGWATEPEADVRPQLRRLKALPAAERQARADAIRDEQREHMQVLRAWWLQRMLSTPRPLQEKLTLFWHGHFATSIRKVRSAYAMYRQNETFRRLGATNWRDLVRAAAQEPAMLLYLDNAQSRASAPNENFARELMELFTLGEGHYTEQDIQESARAFTGWSMAHERFAFEVRPRLHDDGVKTFMGKQGRFDGGDIIDIILDRPEAASFISRKLWVFFAYEEPEPEIVQDLATVLRRHRYDLQPALTALLGSQAFYSARARRTQIKSPVQWLTGTLKAGALDLPPGPMCARMLRRLGQDLFDPPNVKGWDGGTAWINAASLVDRYNGAALLVAGGGGAGARGAFAGIEGAVVLPEARRGSRREAQAYLQRRVFMGPPGAEAEVAIRRVIETMPEPRGWTDAQVRDVVRMMMSTPSYQLT
ncbi:MAG: DUF1800 domain-containing protein [Lentisphaerae bacterium]|nr:DUF1800 domain-containing protein [Lentisphaerota bacterium]